MSFGLVLGGGGLIGMAYHAGALKALEDWGLDLGAADLMIGTSAGSVMASYMRSGWTASDFFDYAHGRHPDVAKDPEDPQAQMRRIFTPLWSTGADRARRMIGSAYAMAASRGYLRRIAPWAALRRAFPAGMYSTDETRSRLAEDLPGAWPDRPLYVCAVDLYRGELVAFGRDGAPEAPLSDAVLASTAIPGVFPPVRIAGRQYVDGGVKSATSLDLAAEDGCRTIICVAPLGYLSDREGDLRDPSMWGPMFVRSLFARALRREVRAARERGINVLVIRPWTTDLKEHGMNSMRYFDRVTLANRAREGTLRFLEQRSDDPALAAWPRSRPTSKREAAR